MKILYIDVYFFLNLTVDMLSLFFSAKVCLLKLKFSRLFFLSLIGALFAIASLLFENSLYSVMFGALFFISCVIFVSKNASFFRRIKVTLVFWIIQVLLGGIVYYLYLWLEENFSELLKKEGGDAENRYALIVSLLILLSIGVIKLLLMILPSNIKEENITIELNIGNSTVSADAFVDSGNLVTDPMNMQPVLFIKADLAEKILPENVITLTHIDALDANFQRRIRLIPVTRNGQTHVITGVRMDKVEVIKEKRREEINVTVAIDNERGTYGGYSALLPLAALKNVL